MHFVVMGCGRVGSEIATSLEDSGHSVAMIDKDPDSFRRLGHDFSGKTVEGVGFDRDTLKNAGITEAYAFAAVSSGDNSNILSARVAREEFNVRRVVARIYDHKRAEVYQRMGIPTVATVRWTADQMLRRMLPAGTTSHFTDSSGSLQLVEINIHAGWVGRRICDLQDATGTRVAYISRIGEGMLPSDNTIIQEGDVAFMMMPEDDASRVASLVTTEPQAPS